MGDEGSSSNIGEEDYTMNIVGGRSVGQTEIICGVVIFIDDGWMDGRLTRQD